jgi:hypothetical protein
LNLHLPLNIDLSIFLPHIEHLDGKPAAVDVKGDPDEAESELSSALTKLKQQHEEVELNEKLRL